MGRKRCNIRLCDHDWYWDVNAGNSDALCHEDSSDPYCSVCIEKWSCQFANFPAQPKSRRYYKLRRNKPKKENLNTYETLLENRKKKRNTKLCEKCEYNNHYDFVWLNEIEQRKYKILELNRKK